MRLWPFGKRETRASSSPYTDTVVEAIIAAAGNATPGTIARTAALEACAGYYQRAFQAARVEPEGARTAFLEGPFLGLVGREIIRHGEQLNLLTVEDGQVGALPAGSWDLSGSHGRWVYRLDLFGPTANTTVTVPEAAVLHFRYATDPGRPWRGLSPMGVASLGGRLAAESEAALGAEMAGPRGHVLPVPTWTSASLDDIKRIVPTLNGRFAFVESVAGGLDDGPSVAPADDWKPKRIGANPPDSLRGVMIEAARLTAGACGVPWPLLNGAEGSAERESYRRFLHSSVEPVARVVERELSAKLEVPVTLDFRSLRAGDMAGRARAFQSLVKAGMAMAEAAAASGVLSEEAA